jgi:hypothetical protein
MRSFAATSVAFLLVTLAAGHVARAATYQLQAQRKAGDTAHVQALLEVTGNLSLAEKGQVRKLKMSVRGCMSYTEQLLAGDAASNSTTCIRHYDRADAKIQVENDLSEPRLRPDRDIVGVAADGEETLLYSPLGSLERDELDLIDLPAAAARAGRDQCPLVA